MTGLRLERPAPGLVVAQPERGFRYAVDAFWLAGFALELGHPRRALDLCTGSGIVAALLASAGLDVVGVDVRPEWRPAWDLTLASSVLAGRLELRAQDLLDLADDGVHDLVLANPPYFRAADGPASPDPLKAAARTESTATLADVVRVALRAVTRAGSAALVVPVERAAEVEDAARSVGGGTLERVDVGRRRAVLRLSRAPGEPTVRRVLADTDPTVAAWTSRFGARPSSR